jgi:GTP-binding protein
VADGQEEAGLTEDPPEGERQEAESQEAERRRAELEAGRLLFARECRFIAGTTTAEALPPAGLPEVAFAGRSNVGKSSLINALTGHNTLARVSHTPGRTQQINFFDLGGRLMLVDLPGYGFAAVGREQSGAWTRLIALYLKARTSLRRLCLLVDGRHGLKDSDRATMTELDGAALSYQIVLTKADKVTEAGLASLKRAIAAELARHPAAHPEIIATSAHKGEGMAELRASLAAVAEFASPALSTPTPLR